MAYNDAYDAQGHLKYVDGANNIGDWTKNMFTGIGNAWNDMTGQSKANMYQNELAQQQAKANASADLLQQQGKDYRTQGDTATGQASTFYNNMMDPTKAGQNWDQLRGTGLVNQGTNYFSNWMNDPASAWNKTAGTAAGIGGAMAGQATDQAINAARGSGLNAGQAALAAGANTANQFTNSTLGAQNSLIGQQNTSANTNINTGMGINKNLLDNQMASASGLSKQGLVQQGLSNDALSGSGTINTNIAGQNKDLYTGAQTSANAATGNLASNAAMLAADFATGGATVPAHAAMVARQGGGGSAPPAKEN